MKQSPEIEPKICIDFQPRYNLGTRGLSEGIQSFQQMVLKNWIPFIFFLNSIYLKNEL